MGYKILASGCGRASRGKGDPVCMTVCACGGRLVLGQEYHDDLYSLCEPRAVV